MKQRFEDFTSLIQQIEHELNRIKTREMAEFGLKGMHALCLVLLGTDMDGHTRAEIVKRTGEDKASISRAVAELLDRGLVVEIEEETGRKYNSKVALTDKGIEIFNVVLGKVERAVAAMGGHLSEEDRTVMYHALSDIRDRLKEY